MEEKLNLLDPNVVQKQLEEETKGEKCDEIALTDLRYTDETPLGEMFKFQDKDYLATPELLEMLLSKIKVPGSFFSRCSPSLKKTILDQFLLSSKANVKMIYDEKSLKGLVSIEMPYVSVAAVFSTAREVMSDAKVQFSEKIGRTYVFNWITNISATPPQKVGDVTRGGVTLEVGLRGNTGHERFGSNVQVGGFLYRLVCLNGMITQSDQVTIVKGNSEENVLNRLGELIRTTLAAVEGEELPRFVQLAEVSVRDPSQVVHRIAQDVGVSQHLQSRILDRLPTLGENPSYYDLVNLITSFANEWAPQRARRLQRLGGEIAVSQEHRCPTCRTWMT